MKLFLTSLWLLPEFRGEFERLVGKPLAEISVVLIENGADDEDGDPKWVQDARRSLTDPGMHVTQLDLRSYLGKKNNDKLRQALSTCDVIWIGGGNTFYLTWILQDTGAGQIITDLVWRGTVYAGGSAGSIVAGPTIHGFEAADDPSFAPALVMDGLSLTDVVVVPHWGRRDYGAVMQAANEALAGDEFKTQPLTDKQALVVDGTNSKVIPEVA